MEMLTRVPDDVAELAKKVGKHDGSSWFHNCHAAALEIVKSGLYPGSRVARGRASGVGMGQHSWVVLPGEDDILANCYDPNARIIDPTLWSYDDRVKGVWEGRNISLHAPHGLGYIDLADLPSFSGVADSVVIEMPAEIAEGLSYRARDFLFKTGAIQYGLGRRVALPARNWMAIANSPVQGWPSPEITDAMYRTPGLAGLLRIDIVGMLTTINPGGLYLPGDEETQ